MDEETSRFLELVREDERAESTQFANAFEWLQTSHSILNVNFAELKVIPDRFSADKNLLDVKNRAAQHLLLLDFVRRLHNYLAAVKTLVDHTRAFRTRYVSDPAFNQECDEQVRQLVNQPVIKFLQDFRNPVLHSRLPRVSITTTFPDGENFRRQLTVSVAELFDICEWSVGARQYIDESQEGFYDDQKRVDLVEAAVRYQRALTKFYQWFYGAIGRVKGPLLAEFVARRSELARIQAEKMAAVDSQSQDSDGQ